MSFRSLLNNTCNIKQRVDTADGQGGYTSTWSILYRRIPCRFNALTADEMTILYDKQNIQADYKLFLEYRSGIKEGNRAVLSNGRIFDVVLVMNWDEANRMLKLAITETDK